jgi:hypothetical protein
MPGSNGPLVTTINKEDKFRAEAMLLFYILKKKCLNKVIYFSKMCYHSKFHTLSGTNVTPTS